MVIPTFATIVITAILTGVLLGIDWYLWRRADDAAARRPSAGEAQPAPGGWALRAAA